MAVAGLKFVSQSSIHLRPNSLFQYVRKVVSRSFVAVDTEDFFRSENGSGWIREEENKKAPKWKKLDCKELGIHDSMIPSTEWKVLNGLKNRGYDVFLVGGCVRDFILKQTPKNYDIVTSAELNQVMETFSRCEIVGKRFPVCHVHIDDITVVVSNYYTPKCKWSFIELGHLALDGCGENDMLRSLNCLNRDFTINGLFLDPYARVVYDYTGGIEDIRKAKVRTIIRADNSFQIDCARILRAICIAARLGFIISKETAHFAKKMSSSVKKLDKGRLLMEIHNMLAYGSGEASLKLLRKFSLLHILLPSQDDAAYFSHLEIECPLNRNMLLSLFSNLDKLLAPNRPCHSSLWLGILAFHKTLSDRPRDPLVVAAFSSAVYNGGNLSEAMKISGMINKRHDTRFLELLYPSIQDSEAFKAQILDLAWSVRGTLLQMIDKRFLNRAMGDFTQAPHSELVCNPLGPFEKTLSIFECVLWGAKEKSLPKQGMKINYKSLARGDLSEMRYVFAKIVFDTVFLDPVSPRILSKEK